MTKREFLSQLGKLLKGLPQQDVDEQVAFYAEMIDDRIEDGLSEEEALREIGNAEAAAAQIVADTPLTRIAKETIRPKKAAGAGEKILLTLGAPLWLSLLLAALAVVAAIYAVLWAAVIALWAGDIALCVGGIGGIFAGALFTVRGDLITGIVILGAGMTCVGLAVLLFFGCRIAARGLVKLSRKTSNGVKRRLMKKE